MVVIDAAGHELAFLNTERQGPGALEVTRIQHAHTLGHARAGTHAGMRARAYQCAPRTRTTKPKAVQNKFVLV
jgi:hypothetical protein